MPSEGLLIVDKPAGMTSHDVVNRIRHLSGIRRVGHAGTLDPLATGVLLLCLGRATRLIEYLVGLQKTYLATVRLGQTTDTYDAEGEIVRQRPIHVNEQAIQEALAAFRGHIQQRAPAYSAVKKDGQPLYKLARQGVQVERPLRAVTIHELTLLRWNEPELQLRVTCSSGTYIRALAHDLGEALGCGGHVTALRRTAVGPFSVEEALPLQELQADNWREHLLPSDTAVQHLPRLDLTPAETRQLLNGQRLPRQNSHPEAPLVRVYDQQGLFIGIAAAQNASWQPRKVFPPDPS